MPAPPKMRGAAPSRARTRIGGFKGGDTSATSAHFRNRHFRKCFQWVVHKISRQHFLLPHHFRKSLPQATSANVFNHLFTSAPTSAGYFRSTSASQVGPELHPNADLFGVRIELLHDENITCEPSPDLVAGVLLRDTEMVC